MVTTDWTHPKHKYPAAAALVLELISLCFISSALFGTPHFTDQRASPVKTAMLLDKKVECVKDVCKFIKATERTNPADWQLSLEIFWMLSFATTFASFMIQALVFWPAVVFGKVLNLVLIVAYALDFLAGFEKVIACFGTLFMTTRVNDAYVWYTHQALRLETLPPSLGFFSMIFSFLAAVMLLVASDVGPRGGFSYLDQIHLEAEKHEHLLRLTRTPSRYRPSHAEVIAPTISPSGETEL